MAVYNVEGNSINTIYGNSGSALIQAYDINGNPLISVSPVSFTVMTFNVQWFTEINSDETLLEEIFNAYDADIVGLQEVRTGNGNIPEPGKTVLEARYDYIYQGNQNNKTAIASTISLSNVSANLFSVGSRGYQKAYFTVGGRTICWINTHLETSSYESQKVAQAQEVFNLVQNENYFIITGDFNTVCKSVNDTEYTTIMKQFVDAGYNCANCTEQHGFIDTWTSGSTAIGTWYPCDHIITSPNISINTVIADTTKIDVASQTSQSIDHLPLIAYLTIN